MYQQFQREAIANIKPGGYADMAEASRMYHFYVDTLFDMAKESYHAFRTTMGYSVEDKTTHGIVHESKMRDFIRERYDVTEQSVDRILFVMLHPEEGKPDRYITERQGGGIVI